MLSASTLVEAALDGILAVPATHSVRGITNTVVSGDTPGQISNAYGFNQVSFNYGNQTVAGNGAGQTIAIVDAYGDSNITSDLHAFDKEFGLPDPVLNVVNQNGGTRLPGNNSGWALETSLDVEWAHAMAPQAKLLLVEANSSNLSDLLSAVNYARNQPGVVAVSMSWGASEFSSETSYDSYFTTPSGHGGITFVAASGDNGAGAIWPGVSPNVLSVGGTTLSLSNGAYGSETAWSGSGGGVSQYEPQPTYQSQSQLVTQSATSRTAPDVAYNADPNSGVAVYDSLSYSGQTGWFQVGGTSAAAPQWSALVAVTDQGRQLANGNTPNSLPNAQASLYSLASNAATYSSTFHDITTGSNGYNAGTGYDLVTGLGTPQVGPLVQALVQVQATASISVTASAPKSGTGSGTPTADPSLVVDLILLDVTPPPARAAFVPLIVATNPSAPAAAGSLVMPAATPMQLATNSMLTDDPTAVPFKPLKRASASSAAAPSAEASTWRTGSSSAWYDRDVEAITSSWLSLHQDSTVANDVADAIFAESTFDGDISSAEPIVGFALASQTYSSPLTVAIGLIAAAVLIERGNRRDQAPLDVRRERPAQRLRS
ncbi:MAG TPA: S53 family peptidase [Pirellulales bacterium]|nr:S53 family peptidase [Pirellulales bacterium]